MNSSNYDSQSGCPDCFKEQRSVNDQYKQTVIDAEKLATQEQKEVAVYLEGQTFRYGVITGTLPAGTREIVKPVQ